MSKPKKPVPKKSPTLPEDDDDAMTQALSELALELAAGAYTGAALHERETELFKAVRKCLQQKNDDVLYDAIERTRYADAGACQYLRGHIEEASSTVLVRREGSPAIEVNAFAIPVFVRSRGGLKEADGFGDQDAFDALVASFTRAGLESPSATVVLIQHAYDLDEIDRISYSQLGEMVREALHAMTDKKVSDAPALARSIVGWMGSAFAPGDEAVELRFLLGFASKRADDPFYAVPANDAAADDYFAARMERYRQWTEDAAPLVARCLGGAGAGLELNFLYQDLFHGAKEQGASEYFMLQMMAATSQALEQHQAAPATVRAVIAPVDVDEEMVLRVNVYGGDGALLASSDKPFDLASSLHDEVDDICDALETIGVRQVALAEKYDDQGAPVKARPCTGR